MDFNHTGSPEDKKENFKKVGLRAEGTTKYRKAEEGDYRAEEGIYKVQGRRRKMTTERKADTKYKEGGGR